MQFKIIKVAFESDRKVIKIIAVIFSSIYGYLWNCKLFLIMLRHLSWFYSDRLEGELRSCSLIVRLFKVFENHFKET